MCREKTFKVKVWGNRGGSPLRVQGKDGIFTEPELLARITPACAGKSDIFHIIFC